MYKLLIALKFRPFLPVKILFKSGGISYAGKIVKRFGKKAFIIIGRGSVKKYGYLDKLISSLDKYGIEYKVFEGIPENPTVKLIDRGAEEGRKFNPDLIIGFGGGSAMDAAKGISVILKNGGSIWDYISFKGKKGKSIEQTPLPIIEIPTVAASGSEANGGAVITNERTKEKAVIIKNGTIPIYSIVDPSLTITLPLRTTVFGGVDMFCHILERYLTTKHDVYITDKVQEYLMKILVEFLPKVLKEPKNLSYREKISFVSTLACSKFPDIGGGSGDMTLHALEHPISGYHPEIPHGAGLASLLPAYINDVCRVNNHRCIKLGKRLFQNENLYSAILHFLKSISAYKTLKEWGIKEDELSLFTQNAIRTGYWLNTHPYPLKEQDIYRIYREAY